MVSTTWWGWMARALATVNAGGVLAVGADHRVLAPTHYPGWPAFTSRLPCASVDAP